MPVTRRPLVVALTVAALVAVGACGSGGDARSALPDTTTTAGETSTTAGAPTTTALDRASWDAVEYPLDCAGAGAAPLQVVPAEPEPGVDVTVVVAACRAGAGSPPRSVFVYDAGRERLQTLWHDGRLRLTDSVTAGGRDVVARGATYSSADVPRCCPDGTFVMQWSWEGGRYRPHPFDVPLRIDRRTDDQATAGFEDVVQATLTDPRGWQQAGVRFTFDDAGAPYTVVLAEADEVQELCRPYDVFGKYSCQNGPVVALNADRWREATPEWTGDLDTYRRMLVNHEVGHLLGQHHPEVQCPAPGEPAPVMAQQSTELDGCLPNPWPLPWELDCAGMRFEPLAPAYEPDAQPRCGPNGPT